VVGAKLRPASASLGDVRLELLLAKLVVEHTEDCDAVTEGLQTGDWGCPDEDGEGHEHDILQNTAKGKDETRSSANL